MEDGDGLQTKHLEKSSLTEEILDKYIPLTGCLCYELFSTNIMVPKKFTEVFGTRDMAAADFLWFHSHVGVGLYLYRQKLHQQVAVPWRITYSVFGAALFNFGSALLWGSAKILAPKTPDSLKVVFGLGTGCILLYIGKSYFEFLNSINKESNGNNEQEKE